MCEPLRFLFAAWDGGGVLPPELAVARQLLHRGHEVRILADPTAEEEVRTAGCQFSPWTTAPHRSTADREDVVIRDWNLGPLELMDTYINGFLGGPAPRWAADTLAELEARPVDVFVADFALPATQIAAEKLGLPRAVLVPNICPVPTKGIPPFGSGFPPARGPLGRLRDALVRQILARVLERALPPINAARAEQGLSPLSSVFQQMLAADRVLVLSSPLFDLTSPAMPRNVDYAGPQLDDPSSCCLPTDSSRWRCVSRITML